MTSKDVWRSRPEFPKPAYEMELCFKNNPCLNVWFGSAWLFRGSTLRRQKFYLWFPTKSKNVRLEFQRTFNNKAHSVRFTPLYAFKQSVRLFALGVLKSELFEWAWTVLFHRIWEARSERAALCGSISSPFNGPGFVCSFTFSQLRTYSG